MTVSPTTPLHITFDPDNHQYRYKARKIPSVTGITGNLSKDALTYWAANQGAEAFQRQVDEWLAFDGTVILDDARVDELYSLIRNAHREVKNTAAAKGNAIHAAIEQYHTDFFTAERPDDPEQAAAWDAFIAWWRESPYSCVATEVMVNGFDGEYSGRFDLLIENDITNDFYVVDIKTGNGTYEDHLAQLAGYAAALEHDGYLIAGTKIVWLPSGCTRAVIVERNHAEWRSDWEAFEHLLRVHQWRKPTAKFMQQICKLYHPNAKVAPSV